MIAVTDEREFVIRYAYGPVIKVKVSFARANVRGVKAEYDEEEEMETNDVFRVGETYRFSPNTARGLWNGKPVVAGKFVMKSEDGLYESMIPWS